MEVERAKTICPVLHSYGTEELGFDGRHSDHIPTPASPTHSQGTAFALAFSLSRGVGQRY